MGQGAAAGVAGEWGGGLRPQRAVEVIELFIHLGTLLQSFEPQNFFSFFRWDFFETIPWSALLKCAYSSSWLPWPSGENKRGRTERHWFGEEGEDGWERWLQEEGCGQRRGMCHMRTEQGVL